SYVRGRPRTRTAQTCRERTWDHFHRAGHRLRRTGVRERWAGAGLGCRSAPDPRGCEPASCRHGRPVTGRVSRAYDALLRMPRPRAPRYGCRAPPETPGYRGDMPQTLPYGSWPSPISATDVAAGSHPIDGGRFVGDDVWWIERLPAEGGRTAVRRAVDGVPETLLPAPWDARSRVHEYGGGAWAVTDSGLAVFVEKTDQRVWAFTPGEPPHPLTP